MRKMMTLIWRFIFRTFRGEKEKSVRLGLRKGRSDYLQGLCHGRFEKAGLKKQRLDKRLRYAQQPFVTVRQVFLGFLRFSAFVGEFGKA